MNVVDEKGGFERNSGNLRLMKSTRKQTDNVITSCLVGMLHRSYCVTTPRERLLSYCCILGP